MVIVFRNVVVKIMYDKGLNDFEKYFWKLKFFFLLIVFFGEFLVKVRCNLLYE